MPLDNRELILLLIAIIGCFVGLATWLGRRDDKNIADATWKGEVNAKLDMIISSNLKNEERFCRIEAEAKIQSDKVSSIEASAKSAHKRLDDHIGKEAT
jgi:hypothetical protein